GGEGKRTGQKHKTQTFTTKGVPVRDAEGRPMGQARTSSRPMKPLSMIPSVMKPQAQKTGRARPKPSDGKSKR
ncbi:MAG: hypothetical protein HOO99_12295, partial [Hyphomicrobiaceae bacterium]|nr:hypothetical protein [Hyphomicrobiaceae bacterium]